MTEPKRPFLYYVMFLALVLAPLALGAKGEEDDWQKATKRGDVRAYDGHLKAYPNGRHAAEARQMAAQKCPAEIETAARSCDPLFLRMIYYAVGVSDTPTVKGDALASHLSRAASCSFKVSINSDDLVYYVDGMLFARSRLVLLPESQLPPRAIIDLDFILFDLEDEIIHDSFKKIVRCNDQSAWVDTPKKVAFECSTPHRELQTRMATAMAEQAQSDFERISRVPDASYRLSFWKQYQALAKNDVMGEIAAAYQLHSEAMKAKKQEPDPKVSQEIEDAAIKLGGGKPTGGYPF